MATTIDFNNPCAAVTILRQALANAIINGRVEEVEFTSGNGSSQRTRRIFGSVAELRTLISEMETECRASQGKSTRYGLRSGGM
jgi:hypothetical protein